jgi:predicted RNA-binding Zn-ribbon protein involved in translation (DUF1610 family)
MSSKHKCPECPKEFLKRTGLGSHLRSAHGIIGSSSTAVAMRLVKAAENGKETQSSTKTSGELVTAAGTKTFQCPECGQVKKNAAELGKHRRFKHGVLGREAAKNQLAKSSHPEGLERNEKRRSIGNQTVSSNQPSHIAYDGSRAPALDPIAYALAVGSLKEFCRNAAEEHGIPSREFTRHCAELLLREARR